MTAKDEEQQIETEPSSVLKHLVEAKNEVKEVDFQFSLHEDKTTSKKESTQKATSPTNKGIGITQSIGQFPQVDVYDDQYFGSKITANGFDSKMQTIKRSEVPSERISSNNFTLSSVRL